jgi:hypothetical protein
MAYQDKEKSLEFLIGLINTYFTIYLSVIYFNIIKVTWKIRKKSLKTKYKQSYSNKEMANYFFKGKSIIIYYYSYCFINFKGHLEWSGKNTKKCRFRLVKDRLK